MKIKKSELQNEVIRYTVELNNQKTGTITVVESNDKVRTGDFRKNVQTVDEFNNNIGYNAVVTKVVKTEVFRNEFIECEIED